MSLYFPVARHLDVTPPCQVCCSRSHIGRQPAMGIGIQELPRSVQQPVEAAVLVFTTQGGLTVVIGHERRSGRLPIDRYRLKVLPIRHFRLFLLRRKAFCRSQSQAAADNACKHLVSHVTVFLFHSTLSIYQSLIPTPNWVCCFSTSFTLSWFSSFRRRAFSFSSSLADVFRSSVCFNLPTSAISVSPAI